MKILYIFPHPDDESFGPAGVIAKQIREGHEVYLLTLTKGGATKQRFKYNYSVEEMGEVRYQEMLEVKNVLGLTDMTVLDLPDSGLKEMDPREIERVIRDHIEKIKPDILVTYAVHGISGFHDHIVTHAAVKRVYLELKTKGYLKRLALTTVNKEQADNYGIKLNFSKDEEIDCEITLEKQDIEKASQCLDCYATYKDVIEEHKIKDTLGDKIFFEFFQESFNNRVKDLTEALI